MDDAALLGTTDTSLAVLEAIHRLDGATASGLTAELDLARSTLYTHLDTLLQNGFLVREGDHYYVALKLFSLGHRARVRKAAYGIVRDGVHDLAGETNEEVSFVVEEHGRLVVIESVISERRRSGYHLGDYLYMHNTSSGKAILSAYSEERVAEILDRWGLPKTTENTITDRERLLRELKATDRRGFATNDEEDETGIFAISSAVEHVDGSVVGAIVIAGPPYRMKPHQETADLLLETINEVEREIQEQGAYH